MLTEVMEIFREWLTFQLSSPITSFQKHVFNKGDIPVYGMFVSDEHMSYGAWF